MALASYLRGKMETLGHSSGDPEIAEEKLWRAVIAKHSSGMDPWPASPTARTGFLNNANTSEQHGQQGEKKTPGQHQGLHPGGIIDRVGDNGDPFRDSYPRDSIGDCDLSAFLRGL